jgi:CheY-like chemotaxis protein
MLVLIIEDDEGLREAIATELRDAGHRVTTASDGSDALEQLRTLADARPDVILLDLMMPNMGGQLFRHRQLADARLADIPTLVMTAWPLDRSGRVRLGGVSVIRKPFETDALLAALMKVTAPAPGSRSCGCGRRYTREAWEGLPLVGRIDNGRNVGELLELRRCACNSTLTWEVGQHALSVRLPVRAIAKVDPEGLK